MVKNTPNFKMNRFAMQQLTHWKNSRNRMPLLIYGLRQTGKTWLMKEFGETNYANFAYLNFDKNDRLKSIFSGDFDINRIIQSLSIETGIQISPKNTLIIFDEIQECPSAFTSLKYFTENAPDYHIVAAGSFLGVMTLTGTGVPVGKYDKITMYPMTFLEFVEAVEPKYTDIIKNLDWDNLSIFHDNLIALMKQYFFVGGMPAAVKEYAQTKSLAEVRKIQGLLNDAYYGDFARHVPTEDITRVRTIWDSVPIQLGKENKRFQYSNMKKGSRGRDYATALQWLKDTRLISIINKVSLPNMPLAAYKEDNIFKIYSADIGLLSAKTDLSLKTYLEDDKLFSHYKGLLAEQFAYQELVANNQSMPLYYWANDKNTAEIEFVAQYDGNTIPIEVKAGKNFKTKSLDVYKELFDPKITITASTKKFGRTNGYAVPLYMIGLFAKIVD